MGLQAQLAASYKANSYVYFVLAASIIELIAACLVCQVSSWAPRGRLSVQPIGGCCSHARALPRRCDLTA